MKNSKTVVMWRGVGLSYPGGFVETSFSLDGLSEYSLERLRGKRRDLRYVRGVKNGVRLVLVTARTEAVSMRQLEELVRMKRGQEEKDLAALKRK